MPPLNRDSADLSVNNNNNCNNHDDDDSNDNNKAKTANNNNRRHHQHTPIGDDDNINNSRRSANSCSEDDKAAGDTTIITAVKGSSSKETRFMAANTSFSSQRNDSTSTVSDGEYRMDSNDETIVDNTEEHDEETIISSSLNDEPTTKTPSNHERVVDDSSDGCSTLWNFSWISHLWRTRTTTTTTKSESTTRRSHYLSSSSPKNKQPRFCLFRRWNETTASGWQMAKVWVFGIMTPVGLVAWIYTHQVTTVLASILILPSIAILQGSVAILKYRVQFGDSPLPKAPSHGIVKCVSKTTTFSTNDDDTTVPTQPITSNSSGFSQIGYGSSSSTKLAMSTNGNGGRGDAATNAYANFGESATSFQGFVDPEHHRHPTTSATSPTSSSTVTTTTTTPLRLLVIGDSLAIGVGQSATATPVMPETIAKSLSKAMHGRPVLWSCHGAPGASAGWIVRELERSIQYGQFLQACPPNGPAYPGTTTASTSSNQKEADGDGHRRAVDGDNDSCSSSGDSSSSLSNEETTPILVQSNEYGDNQEELRTWSERLKEHRIRFDPNVLGPFDIAVVLTGSNDLKSAFFPFLLTGEDAEFRRQAQERGGGYGSELTRILQVLNRRMRMRLQTLRESVEAATERVMESVDNIRERLNSQDLNGNGEVRSSSSFRSSSIHRRIGRCHRNLDGSSTTQADSEEKKEGASLLESYEGLDGVAATQNSLRTSPQFPMVVLPGMPARALPIFQIAPLRWLAVPIVDIMDSHKKKLARHHDGEVLFVDAPTCEAIADYSNHVGLHWEQESDDRVLLNLRGIKRKQVRAIESDMEAYFSKKRPQPTPETLPLRRRHHSMFSIDGIHPNDQGYDFWGRYIADAIVEEWKRNQKEFGTSSNLV